MVIVKVLSLNFTIETTGLRKKYIRKTSIKGKKSILEGICVTHFK
jgi:hypothetical protein